MNKHVKAITVMNINGKKYSSWRGAYNEYCSCIFHEWCDKYEKRMGGASIYHYQKEHQRCFDIHKRVSRRTINIFKRAYGK